jgi:hypothetical protein
VRAQDCSFDIQEIQRERRGILLCSRPPKPAGQQVAHPRSIDIDRNPREVDALGDPPGFGSAEEQVRAALKAYAWPGNIRELNHVIERAVLMAQENVIRPVDLGLQPARIEARPLDEMSLEEVEIYLIRKTLTRFEGNASKAAEALGLSRSAFYRRLDKYRL